MFDLLVCKWTVVTTPIGFKKIIYLTKVVPNNNPFQAFRVYQSLMASSLSFALELLKQTCMFNFQWLRLSGSQTPQALVRVKRESFCFALTNACGICPTVSAILKC